jgi:exonuclease VII small subunit
MAQRFTIKLEPGGPMPKSKPKTHAKTRSKPKLSYEQWWKDLIRKLNELERKAAKLDEAESKKIVKSFERTLKQLDRI